MSLFEKLSGKAALHRLQGLTADDVKNAFFANYLAALMMVKLRDVKGLVLVNDPSHKKLQSFGGKITDLCFFGRALFCPTDPQVVDALRHGEAEILQDAAGKVQLDRIYKIIDAVMRPPEQLDWNEVIASVMLLRHRYSLVSSYFNKIMRAFMKWDRLTVGDKDKVVADCFMYLLQSDMQSALLPRMREITTAVQSLAQAANKLTKVVRLPATKNGIFEEDGGASVGTSAGNVASGDAATGNSIIDQMCGDHEILPSTYQFDKAAGKATKKKGLKYEKIKKRERRFKVIKFKSPSTTTRK